MQHQSRRHRVYQRDGGVCFYCRQPVPFQQMTLDHFIPRSALGTNSSKNRVVACERCNLAKDNFDPRTIGLANYRSHGHAMEAFRMEVAASAMRNLTYRNYHLAQPVFHHQRIFIE